MNVAIVVAAGSGSRMKNLDRPKQFLLVKRKPLFIYSLEAFEKNDKIDAIIVVTSKDYLKQVKKWCLKFNISKVKGVVLGGATRQESVNNGLMAAGELINDWPSDIILIHDSARPLVSQEIINNNIQACLKYDAVTTVINASDTIVHSLNGDIVNDVPSRKELYQSQTPQTFKAGLILEAHVIARNNNIKDATDDAQLVIAYGRDVHLVKGEKNNFKVTTDVDLVILKALLK